MVAVPVVVGSLGRIPVGALTDRFGGRIMFPLVSVATIVPVLYLGLAGHTSLTGLLVGGFFLGIGGTAFAVGVPFVSAWFPPARRGFAIGVFGVGMGGTAISALTTVKLVTAHGTATPFVVTAIVLAVYAVLAALVLRDAPDRVVPTEPLTQRLAATLRLRVTWQACRAVRGRVRRLRRVLRLPARVPQDRLRADPGRRREPDGRVRAPRGGDAPGRRLAVRPARPDPGPAASRWPSSWPARLVQAFTPSLGAAGHDRVPGHGRRARRGQRRDVRAGGACWPRRTRSARSPASSAPPAASAASCRRW